MCQLDGRVRAVDMVPLNLSERLAILYNADHGRLASAVAVQEALRVPEEGKETAALVLFLRSFSFLRILSDWLDF